MLSEAVPVTAVAGHLGDTVQTVSQVYAHWLRDDRDVPAEALDRILRPGAPALHDASAEGLLSGMFALVTAVAGAEGWKVAQQPIRSPNPSAGPGSSTETEHLGVVGMAQPVGTGVGH
jgi:hypothetical protein